MDGRPSAATDGAASLARRLGVHPLAVSLLLGRGLTNPSELSAFLDPALSRLEDPFAFTGMSEAVRLIRAAAGAGQKILVYGDYDVDGVTSAAILTECIRRIGGRADALLPHRSQDGYGLRPEAVSKIAGSGCSLLVTADNGIGSAEAVESLARLGIQTVIVDHHQPKDRLPDAAAIVSSCLDGRGDPSLAACGLSFKLAWALTGRLEEAEDFLDLVVIGTIADQAPLIGDNRILVKQGLARLASSRRPGVRALLAVSGVYGNRVSQRDVAFGLAPRINAAGRMDSPESAFRLLTASDEAEASSLAARLEEMNRLRRKAEAGAYRDAVRLVKGEEDVGEHVIVVASPAWHEGILGILASRLAETFGRPALTIALKDGVGKGSGRSREGGSLFAHVKPHEGVFESFGGHARALGFSIRTERVDELRRRLNEYPVEPDGTPEEAPPSEPLPLASLTSELIDSLERLEPFGPGHPKPRFFAGAVSLKGPARRPARGGIRRWVSDPASGTTCEAVWPAALGAAETKKIQGASGALDIWYWPQWHRVSGIASVRLEIADWRASAQEAG